VGGVIVDHKIEIYNQRYETFRHLDALRWQKVNVVVALIGAVAALPSVERLAESPWSYVLLGFAFALTAFAMHRINNGYRANGKVLIEIGALVGDEKIPDVTKSRIGAYLVLIGLVALSGFACFVYAAVLTIGKVV
jgi:hypothetical protein